MKRSIHLLFVLFAFIQAHAQNQLYLGPIRYTSTGFTVYQQNCFQPNGIQFWLNDVQLSPNADYTEGFCQSGICQVHFAFGLLKPGDKLEVRDACGSTPMSRIVEDDFIYVEVPDGSSYSGNNIGPNDQAAPYGRLANKVQVGQCEEVEIGAHALHQISFLIGNKDDNSYTSGVWKLNGQAISNSSFVSDDFGNGTVFDINADGSIAYKAEVGFDSKAFFSGESPTTFEYIHNGVLPFDIQEIKFGPMGVRMWDNGHITVKEYRYDGSVAEEEQYIDITNSHFKLFFGNGKFQLFVDDVLLKTINRSVVYSASGGTISDLSLLPYKSKVTWKPSATGAQWVQAIIDGVRTVRQYFTVADDLLLDGNVTNVACNAGNDGRIAVEVSGGQAPFRYSIDGGNTFQSEGVFSGLSAGIYTIRLQDASGCEVQKDFNVLENSPLVLSSSTMTDASCAGQTDGSVSLKAAGGGGFYEFKEENGSYSSNATFTNLAAGEHTFWVKDASACEASFVLSVGVKSTLAASVLVTDVHCYAENTGQIEVLQEGTANGPVQYALNGVNYQSNAVFSGLQAGNYTVYIQDDVCTLQMPNQNVAEPAKLVAKVDVSQSVSCFGGDDGKVNSVPTGGTSPYFFSLDGQFVEPAESSHAFENLSAGNYKVWVKDAQGCQKDTVISVDEPGNMVLSILDKTDASCFGSSDGTAHVEVTGGNGGHTYSIGSQVYNLDFLDGIAAGHYDILATDSKGCESTTELEILEPEEIVLNPSIAKQVSCFSGSDGEMSIEATGGTGFLSYSIDNVNFQAQKLFVGLGAGEYTVYVKDANNCLVDSVGNTVTQPDLLVLQTEEIEHVLCYGGSDGEILLKGTGGVPGYSFSNDGIYYISDSTFVGLSKGNHTFWIKDAHQCTASAAFEIIEPAKLQADLSVIQNVLCYGGQSGELSTNVSGGASPYQFSLDGLEYASAQGSVHTIDTLQIGTYQVWVRDANNCEVQTNQVNLTEPTALVPAIAKQVDVSCHSGNNGSVSLLATGGVGDYTFWLNGTQSDGFSTFSGLSAGSYTFVLKDGNACEKEISTIIAEPLSAYQMQLISQSNLSCFENQSGIISIENNGGTSPYRVWLTGEDTLRTTNASFTDLKAKTYSVYGLDANDCSFELNGIELTQPTEIQISLLEKEDVDCDYYSRGRSKLIASGSNGGFSYTLSGEDFEFKPIVPIHNTHGEFDKLKAGNYQLTATDQKGCQKQHTVSIISKNSTIRFELVPTLPSSCLVEDGQVKVANVSGGREPYQFSISGQNSFSTSPQFDNLLNGNYIVTVSDSLCSYKKEVDLSLPESLKADYTISPIACSTPDANLEIAPIAGGNGNYQLALNGTNFATATSFSRLPPNVYTVLIKDNPETCRTMLSLEIKEQNRADLTFLERTDILCNGKTTGVIEVVGNNNLSPFQYGLNEKLFGNSGRFENLSAGTYILYAQNSIGCLDSLKTTLNEPSALNTTVLQNNNLCFGDSTGRLTLTAEGGTSPYQFSMDGEAYFTQGNFQNLKAGDYKTYVKDAHACVSMQAAKLIQPSEISVTPVYADTVRCKGEGNGLVKVSASGGTPNYQFSKDGFNYFTQNTFSNLSAAKYVFYVKDKNQCVKRDSVTLFEPDSLLLSIDEKVNPLCFAGQDGEISVLSSGGNGGNRYFINNANPQFDQAFGGLKQGIYSIKVEDRRACQFTVGNIELTHPDQLKHQIATVEPLCFEAADGQIALMVEGGTAGYRMKFGGAEYFPNKGKQGFTFDELLAGEFFFTTLDSNGCADSFAVELKQPTALKAKTSITKNLCFGDSTGTIQMEGFGATSPYTYALSMGGESDSSFSSKRLYSGLLAREYTVHIEDANACRYDTLVTVEQPEEIEFVSFQSDSVRCFGERNGRIVVQAKGGSPEYAYSADGTNFQLSNTLGNLKKGAYSIRVRDKNGCLAKGQDSVAVGEPERLELRLLSKENPLCAGDKNGRIELAAKGGNTGNEFSIDNRLRQDNALFEGLSEGDYTFKVEDRKGCMDTVSVVHLQWPEGLAAKVTTSSPTCVGDKDGSTTLHISGGAGEYSAKLYNAAGDSILSAKGAEIRFDHLLNENYQVRVADAKSCALLLPIRVNTAESLNAEINLAEGFRIGDLVETCEGQVLHLDARNPERIVHWYKDGKEIEDLSNKQTIEIAEEGMYSVLVSNASGCTVADTFELRHNQFALHADFLIPTQAFVGDTVVCLDITDPLPDEVLWFPPLSARVLNETFSKLEMAFEKEGLYHVEMKANQGECQNVVVHEIEILEMPSDSSATLFDENIQSIRISPNPNSGLFDFQIKLYQAEKVEVEMVNAANGHLVFSEAFENEREINGRVDVAVMPGLYIFYVKTAKELQSKRVLIIN
ncbi:hypothetical protein LAG90_08675 [Marinilongibacter aquaticus]|uniref:T9SS type A sorting domain-containing protein n=1 Tax=Marinilongibacter aquaticus TaxID=2975157 RepID=UPI0021BD587D|nr:T9SS type A sorting domain-containing protein [Marinilongibacter aquaticus]UBM60708.1 hypothetical protein LAG90_08675 [Marinilongibacter aquaticus]